jgi:hypothetical protein
VAPFATPGNKAICRKERPRVHDPRPLGAAMRSSAPCQMTLSTGTPGAWVAPPPQSLAHRLLYERADLRLFLAGQLRQREGGRPHGAVVEACLFAEAERRVPPLELLGALEEADVLPSLLYRYGGQQGKEGASSHARSGSSRRSRAQDGSTRRAGLWTGWSLSLTTLACSPSRSIHEQLSPWELPQRLGHLALVRAWPRSRSRSRTRAAPNPGDSHKR